MKVMHLMSTHAFSGAENVACQIINAFKNDKNYEMIYVSEINENKKNLEDRNINYYRLNKFNYKNVKKAVLEIKPDIIHAHDIRASIIASLFNKKVRVISHVHANHENMRKLCFKTVLFNLLSNKIYKIIWVSKSALYSYKFYSKIASKSYVLYNVINPTELYDKIKQDKRNYEQFDLIYLGRLSYQKNPIRLIEIINLLKKNKNDIKVAIVGDGELKENVEFMIHKYKLEENIKMFGFVNNPYKILNSSKILIMTSRYEGTPMCALEAIALGKPIISTPTDGLADIIDNGNTGYLSNNDAQLCNKIIELCNNRAEYKRIKNNLLEVSTTINSIENYKKEVEKIYQ